MDIAKSRQYQPARQYGSMISIMPWSFEKLFKDKYILAHL